MTTADLKKMNKRFHKTMPEGEDMTYEVFELREGLLKIPKETEYGRTSPIFVEDFETMVDAEKVILEHPETYGHYIVLPVVKKT